jgi:hypothetical protein
MTRESFGFVRVRGQLVWVRTGATADEVAAAFDAREQRIASTAAVEAGLPSSFDPDDPRPLLLIDIDGVVCPLIDTVGAADAAGFRSETLGTSRVWISDAIGARLRDLGSMFQLVWCTAWQVRAAEFIGPRLGLPAMPVIRFGDETPDEGHWKWTAIDAFVGDRPFAWIDDELDETDLRIGRARETPSLLVRIDAAVGLDDAHVASLTAFARGL